ncbi:AAA family ATPase [Nodularia sphaerocarpa]|uniref:AAA family ATPase n=1 Tax=Nodularia sphaerocarpa TaxID=137816 RepID=UPI001EFC285E|nr:AAA family ATPase [Nodularia sphaerocarpa]MDB9375997.1 AAA family ATPase [Nodularia sphaerocarpa CS-585]MDB9379543.1 AAA family ATPase [Nodularia sphaerocarpa CS-585A2]ULP72131.1 ATP-dependent zinc metalloprotease FtsH [Nodularia sphaerocarpa UHCC 0038]
MNFREEFKLLLRARYPLIYIPTYEEERVETAIREEAANQGNRLVYTWDFVDGYQGNPNDAGFGKRNPLQALEFVEKMPASAPAVLILRDYHRFLDDVAIARKLRNLSRLLKSQPKNLVLLSPRVAIPDDLTEVLTVVEFPLPAAPEIKTEVERLLQSTGQNSLSGKILDDLVRSCQGLSMERIRRVLARAIASHGELQPEDVDLVLEEKRQTIRQTQILDFYPATERISDIGGLDNLKDWLLRRGGSFSEKARQYGLPHPRGLMLLGIQGTGKSLTAKAIAHHWHLPLLRLDVGRLFGGLVGESESRTRQMIQVAEALAPCVLWIDEIDKAFSGLGSKGDAGTASRVFGTFITWLAEKTSPVFVVSTANDIQALPPEMLRKGRFDEIFFVGLPSQDERKAIFNVHLSRLRPHNLKAYDIDRLAYETPDFSGAEIEQTLIEAMHIGFSQNRDFTNDDILEAASQIIPLARTAVEQIQQLQEWAASGRARLASKHTPLTDTFGKLR